MKLTVVSSNKKEIINKHKYFIRSNDDVFKEQGHFMPINDNTCESEE